MRILYVCGDRGVPAFGRKGASTHVREMIAALRQLGHEVVLAAANLEGERRRGEDFPAHTWSVPAARVLGSDLRAFWGSRNAEMTLRRLLRTFRPDAIYERSAIYFTAGERAVSARKLPRILEVNTLLAEEQRTRLHFPAVAARMERNLIRNAEAIAAISPVLRDRLIEDGTPAKRIRVFSMAVDPDRFVPTGARDATLREAGLPPTQRVLGYVGSMNHYHKPTLFAEMLERILPEDPGVSALFVGGADDKIARYDKRLAPFISAGRVVFAGSVPNEEMGRWLEAMDLIVIPGAAPQSTPTKIFEAAALGRAMVLPATVPIRSLCEDGAESLLFPEDDLEVLLLKVRKWRADPTELEQASAVLRTTVLAKHTWRSEAAHAVAWLEELLANPR